MAALQQLQQLTMLQSAMQSAGATSPQAQQLSLGNLQPASHRKLSHEEEPHPQAQSLALGTQGPTSSTNAGEASLAGPEEDPVALALLRQQSASMSLLQQLLQQPAGAQPLTSQPLPSLPQLLSPATPQPLVPAASEALQTSVAQPTVKGAQSLGSPKAQGSQSAQAGAQGSQGAQGSEQSPAFMSELVKRLIRKELRNLKEDISRVVDAKICPLRETIDRITSSTQQMAERQPSIIKDMVIEEAHEMREEYNEQLNSLASAMEDKLLKLNTQQHKLVHEARIFARQHQKSTTDQVAQSERRILKNVDSSLLNLRTDLLDQTNPPREGQTSEGGQGSDPSDGGEQCKSCGADWRRIQKLEITVQAQQNQLKEMDSMKKMMFQMQSELKNLQNQRASSSLSSPHTPTNEGSPLSGLKRRSPEEPAVHGVTPITKPVALRPAAAPAADAPQGRCQKFSKTTFRSDLKLPRIGCLDEQPRTIEIGAHNISMTNLGNAALLAQQQPSQLLKPQEIAAKIGLKV